MPPRRTNPAGYQNGRALRKRLTSPERKLWTYLRNQRLHGVLFRRQHAIGPCVADFCSPRHHLVIELDGIAHLQGKAQDLQRTEYLGTRGYRVLRFWNHDVLSNLDGVIAAIVDALGLS